MVGAGFRTLQRAAAIAVALLIGCASEHPYVWIKDLPPAPEPQPAIGGRDVIQVVVANQPSLSGEFTVRDDGSYLQPMVGNIPVVGKTPSVVGAELQIRLKDLVVDPLVAVSILRPAPVRVSVVGEVRNPGSYELARDRGVVPALAAAGWLTEFASRDRIFVVRAGYGDKRIRFRTGELTGPQPYAGRFQLRDGDVVVVE
jgi:polysaccharide export outer membrane protein